MPSICRGWTAFAASIMVLLCGAASALTVTVESVTEDTCDGTVSTNVLISGFAQDETVSSFGIDITFDTSILTFQSAERGTAVAEWGFFGANVIAPGTVRIGGARLTGPRITADTDLFLLNFARTCPSGNCNTSLDITNINPPAGANGVDGVIACGQTSEGEGGAEGEGVADGEGTPDGEGAVEGVAEGEGEGVAEGSVEGTPEGTPEGSPEGSVEGSTEGSEEGSPEGSADGEGEPPVDNPPVAVCQNITVNLPSTGFALVTAAQIDGGSTDDNGIVSRQISKTSFLCSDLGENQVTLTVRDAANQTSTCTAIVTVRDQEGPIVACKDFATTLNENGRATIQVSDVDNNSRDACGVASKVLSKTEFTCADVGPNVVTLTVTDNNGNVGTCEATVTIADIIFACAEVPTYTLAVQTQGNGTVTVQTPPNAEDGVSYVEGTQVTITAQPADGFTFSGWQGDTGGATLGNNSITVAMTQDRALTAVFEEGGTGGGDNPFGCHCVAFEGEDGSTGCTFVGLDKNGIKNRLGEFFLAGLTVMVLLLMSAYQKRFW